MPVRHLNPDGMHSSPAFSQAVVVESPAKTIYIGGQNGVDASGEVVGDSLGEQTVQALRNVATIVEAEGGSLANVVRWTIATVEGSSVEEGFSAFQQVWDPTAPPPAITVLLVPGFANPRFLVEIDAIAVV